MTTVIESVEWGDASSFCGGVAPPPCAGHAACIGPNGFMYMAGGNNSADYLPLQQTRTWDPEGLHWALLKHSTSTVSTAAPAPLQSPLHRAYHSMFYVCGRLLCLGVTPPDSPPATAAANSGNSTDVDAAAGENPANPFLSVLQLNLSTMAWERCTDLRDGPPARSAFCGAAVKKRLFIFGGLVSRPTKVLFDDFWSLSVDHSRWYTVHGTGTPPSRRCHSSMASYKMQLFIFGGFGGNSVQRQLNDLHCFDLDTGSWTQPKLVGSPYIHPRNNHTMAAIGDKLFVFGGRMEKREVANLAVLDTTEMRWTEVTPAGTSPSPRTAHSAVAMPARPSMDAVFSRPVGPNDMVICVYGGYGGVNVASRTWLDDLHLLLVRIRDEPAPMLTPLNEPPRPRKRGRDSVEHSPVTEPDVPDADTEAHAPDEDRPSAPPADTADTAVTVNAAAGDTAPAKFARQDTSMSIIDLVQAAADVDTIQDDEDLGMPTAVDLVESSGLRGPSPAPSPPPPALSEPPDAIDVAGPPAAPAPALLARSYSTVFSTISAALHGVLAECVQVPPTVMPSPRDTDSITHVWRQLHTWLVDRHILQAVIADTPPTDASVRTLAPPPSTSLLPVTADVAHIVRQELATFHSVAKRDQDVVGELMDQLAQLRNADAQVAKIQAENAQLVQSLNAMEQIVKVLEVALDSSKQSHADLSARILAEEARGAQLQTRANEAESRLHTARQALAEIMKSL